ncbi:hypothetical protein MANES_08G123950v8 [Manihot esculenta]|uniref:Uncharacterized protein n=1 Tax=Manihot esculenta TaxID=3983 RepID=A0ACB7HFQ5_MANES|nr:hypothetical protein MANES_08G123950v8 [Manihot esculenta]
MLSHSYKVLFKKCASKLPTIKLEMAFPCFVECKEPEREWETRTTESPNKQTRGGKHRSTLPSKEDICLTSKLIYTSLVSILSHPIKVEICFLRDSFWTAPSLKLHGWKTRPAPRPKENQPCNDILIKRLSISSGYVIVKILEMCGLCCARDLLLYR